jgi:neutral ceramidase
MSFSKKLPTFCAALLVSLVFTSAGFAEKIKAGTAQVDITPPVGYRMAGYFNERLSTGTHDPLWAKAIILDDGKQKLAMVFCDLVGVSLNISTNARAMAYQRTGIPISNILISASHSHTAPLFEGVIRNYLHDVAVKQFGKDPREEVDYPKQLINGIVEAIVAANKELKPVELKAGIGVQDKISFNRRFHMKNGTVAFNPGQLNPNIVKPAGPNDPDVGILMLEEPKKNKPIGGLTVFAMHQDTVGGTEYSADYAYYLERLLKESLGTNYFSAFAAGTCGDINHMNVKVQEPYKGFEVCEKLGRALGQSVLDAAPKLKEVKKPSFAVRSQTISAPMQTVTPEQLASAKEKMAKLTDSSAGFFLKVEAVKALDLAEKGPAWPMEVQAFRLDKDTALVGLPCEIFVELGLAIKKASPFKNTIVMSICNDRPSYVPTRKAFSEGSYEVTNARVKPEAGEMLVETAIKLLRQLK